SVAALEAQVGEARGARPLVAGGDQVCGDVDAEHVGAAPGDRQRRGAVAAAEVENLRAGGDGEVGDELGAALAHGPRDAREIAFLPQRLVGIGNDCNVHELV